MHLLKHAKSIYTCSQCWSWENIKNIFHSTNSGAIYHSPEISVDTHDILPMTSYDLDISCIHSTLTWDLSLQTLISCMVTWQEQWHIQVCLSGLDVVRFTVIAVTFTPAVAHSSRSQLMHHSVASFSEHNGACHKHLYMLTMLMLIIYTLEADFSYY